MGFNSGFKGLTDIKFVSFSKVTSLTAPKGLNHPEINDNYKHRISIFFLIQRPIPTFVTSSTAAKKKIT